METITIPLAFTEKIGTKNIDEASHRVTGPQTMKGHADTLLCSPRWSHRL